MLGLFNLSFNFMCSGSTVRLSVWDIIGSDFRAFLSATNMKKRVVVITAVKPKMYSGELYLNTSSAIRYYMDEDLAEFKKYMSMYVQQQIPNNTFNVLYVVDLL